MKKGVYYRHKTYSEDVANMQPRSFPVIFEPDVNGGYVVSCPVFPGCYSEGDTIDEALSNIKEAIELCIEELKEKNLELPNVDRITIGNVVIEA